ncbi:MAG: helix-turn-helix domain-containing protein [Butyricicoccus sp.]|nr:helix-turn-helix domain-containing protein [Butyricicoccus sp.]
MPIRRQKIEDDPKHPVILKTVWGKGYCCEELG